MAQRKSLRTLAIVVLAISVFGSRSAHAQQRLEIRLDLVVEQGEPVVVGDTPLMFGGIRQFLRRASIPFGFEAVDAFREQIVENGAAWPGRRTSVPVKGLTVRAALDAIVAADPRFAWREIDGVVVMRPAGAWNDPLHPLQLAVPPVQLDRVHAGGARDAIRIATGHFHPPARESAVGPVFSMAFPGGSLLDLLNALLAANSELAWALERAPVEFDGRRSVLGPRLFFHGEAILDLFDPPAAALPVLVAFSGAQEEPAKPVVSPLDLRLPPDVTQVNADTVTTLLLRLGVPAGFEQALALIPRASKPFRAVHGADWPDMALPPGPMVDITGLTIRGALDRLVAVDRRYEWREMDGVVVVRPPDAWADGAHPLERAARAVRLRDVHLSDLYDVMRRALDPKARERSSLFGQEAEVSLDFAGGSLFELLNEIVRSHGRMAWSLTVDGALVPLDRQHGAMLAEPVLSLGTQWESRGTPLEPRPATQLRLPGSR